MALGECFTRSAVACEFSVFADFANSSRRRLLRPTVGFRDNEPALGPRRAAASFEGGALFKRFVGRRGRVKVRKRRVAIDTARAPLARGASQRR